MTGSGAEASGDVDGQDPRAAAGSRTYRRALIALFCAGLATLAQMYSPQGILPHLAHDFEVSAGLSSWAIGSTTIGVALGVIPWARLSDRFGRIQAMRAAMAIAMLLGVAAPLMPTFELFLALRFAEGLALAGLPAIAVTALAETVRPVALGAAVGTYISGTTIGGLVGRILAAEVDEFFGWRWGMGAVAIVAGVATLLFLVRIPNTAVPRSPAMPTLPGILANLRNPGVVVLMAQAFLLMGGFVATYNYLAFRLQDPPFELSLAQASWLFLSYLAGAISSRWVWRLARKLSPTAVLLLCLAVMLVGLAITQFDSLIAVTVGLVAFTGGFFAAHSIASGLIERRAGDGRSIAPPLYNLGYYAGSSVLGWAGGLAFAAGGWVGTSAMVAAAILVAGALAWGYSRRER